MKLEGFCFLGELRNAVRLADATTDKPLVAGKPFQLAKTGRFFSQVYGQIDITRDMLATMVRNFKDITPLAPTEIPVDYDHLSDEPKQPGDGAAAGWVKELALRADGDELWCRADWTKRAANLIAEGAYRFVSPYFLTAYKDKATNKDVGATLKAVAITNRPFLEGMQEIPAPAIAASDAPILRIDKQKALRERTMNDAVAAAEPPKPPVAAPPAAPPPAPPAAPPPAPPAAPPPAAPPVHQQVAPPVPLSAPGAPPPPAAPAPGAITCPHCGAPVRHVASQAPAAPPAPHAPPAPGAAPPAPGAPPAPPSPNQQEEKKPVDDKHQEIAASDLDQLEAQLMETATGTDDDDSVDLVRDANEPVAAAEQPATPAVAASEAPSAAAIALSDELERTKAALAAAQRALSETQSKARDDVAARLLDIGLRTGRLTRKLIGSKEKPGWAMNEANRDPKAFRAWLEAAPKIWEPSTLGTATEPEGGRALAFAEKVNRIVQEKRAANPALTYADATKLALREQPSLATEYDRELNVAGPSREVTAISSNTAV